MWFWHFQFFNDKTHEVKAYNAKVDHKSLSEAFTDFIKFVLHMND